MSDPAMDDPKTIDELRDRVGVEFGLVGAEIDHFALGVAFTFGEILRAGGIIYKTDGPKGLLYQIDLPRYARDIRSSYRK